MFLSMPADLLGADLLGADLLQAKLLPAEIPLSVCAPRYRFQTPPRSRAVPANWLLGLGSGLATMALLGLLSEQARLLLVSGLLLASGGTGLGWHGARWVRLRVAGGRRIP